MTPPPSTTFHDLNAVCYQVVYFSFFLFGFSLRLLNTDIPLLYWTHSHWRSVFLVSLRYCHRRLISHSCYPHPLSHPHPHLPPPPHSRITFACTTIITYDRCVRLLCLRSVNEALPLYDRHTTMRVHDRSLLLLQ